MQPSTSIGPSSAAGPANGPPAGGSPAAAPAAGNLTPEGFNSEDLLQYQVDVAMTAVMTGLASETIKANTELDKSIAANVGKAAAV
jgi:hypothetical protein